MIYLTSDLHFWHMNAMDDMQAPPAGCLGTVHVAWDNGGSLGVVYGVDKVKSA